MNARAHTRIGLYIGIMLMSGMLYSCGGKDVLSSRQMVAVLTDLHRMDGMLQVKGHNYRDVDEAAYYDAVLAKHGVTQAQFDSSLVWYTHHPQRFNKLYPRVMKRLEAEHALYEDKSATQKALLEDRKKHFDLFTCKRVMVSVQKGYPLDDYRLPPVETLDVTIPFLQRMDEQTADE